jgi:hypothetical protein
MSKKLLVGLAFFACIGLFVSAYAVERVVVCEMLYTTSAD